MSCHHLIIYLNWSIVQFKFNSFYRFAYMFAVVFDCGSCILTSFAAMNSKFMPE
jgi:hypothetical protein